MKEKTKKNFKKAKLFQVGHDLVFLFYNTITPLIISSLQYPPEEKGKNEKVHKKKLNSFLKLLLAIILAYITEILKK
jgi:hypothetical protein